MRDSSQKLGMLQKDCKATRGMRPNTRLWKVAVISDRYFTPYVTNNVDAEARSLPVHSQQSLFQFIQQHQHICGHPVQFQPQVTLWSNILFYDQVPILFELYIVQRDAHEFQKSKVRFKES